MDFSTLQEEAYAIAQARGLYTGAATFGEYAAMVHAALSKALESYRLGMRPEPELLYSTSGHPIGIPFDLAGAVAGTAALARHYEIPVAEALDEHLETGLQEAQGAGESRAFCQAAHQWVEEQLRPGEQPHFAELIALAHRPLADALGAARTGSSPAAAADGLAQAVIWVFGIGWRHRIDLTHAIAARMAYYRQRNHGKKSP